MSDRETKAAERALGVSPFDHSDAQDTSVDDDVELEALLQTWEARLAPIADTVKPKSPPIRVWSAVKRRLGNKNTVLPKGVEAVYRGDGEWWSFAENVDVKSLFIDEKENTESFLLRIKPGGLVEPHFHDGFNDECMVIEGVIMVGETRFGPGDFHVAKKGSEHPPLYSHEGGILFVRSERITGIIELTQQSN